MSCFEKNQWKISKNTKFQLMINTNIKREELIKFQEKSNDLAKKFI